MSDAQRKRDEKATHKLTADIEQILERFEARHPSVQIDGMTLCTDLSVMVYARHLSRPRRKPRDWQQHWVLIPKARKP